LDVPFPLAEKATRPTLKNELKKAAHPTDALFFYSTD
jgi:hypothetical protein